MSRKIVLIIFGGFIFIAIIAGIALYVASRNKNSIANNTGTASTTNQSQIQIRQPVNPAYKNALNQTYRNSFYNLSIMYPEGLVATEVKPNSQTGGAKLWVAFDVNTWVTTKDEENDSDFRPGLTLQIYSNDPKSYYTNKLSAKTEGKELSDSKNIFIYTWVDELNYGEYKAYVMPYKGSFLVLEDNDVDGHGDLALNMLKTIY